MKKMIFTDVDGTIYDRNSIITPQLRKDIKFAQSKGYEVVIATGNPAFEKMIWLSNELKIRYLIASNGATVYDNNKKTFIYKSQIGARKSLEVQKIATKHKLGLDFWDDKRFYLNKFVTQKFCDVIEKVAFRGNPNIEWLEKPSLNFAFKLEVYGNDEKIVDKFYADVKSKVNLQFARMTPKHLEMNDHGVSKKMACMWLAQKLKVKFSDCMTIGDSANDIAMLSSTNFSYAMGNASPEVKRIAKFTTQGVLENGLGLAIRDYIERLGK